MKKTMKKILCSLLVVVMCLTSAPLQGFVGLEWPSLPEINFGNFELPKIDFGSWFSSKASAATEGYYTYTVTDGEATITDVDTSISGDITIPATLGGYSVTTIGYEAFYCCTNLTSITIPNSITTIENRAFCYCPKLKNITIGNSVTTIGNFAFSDCTSLTSITIPDSVTTIGTRAFSSCESLTRIVVSVGNKFYSGDSFGVLYNKNKTELIQYPIGNVRTEFTIPATVTTIAEGAFKLCKSLTSIIISDGVTTIGNSAFYRCENLISVTIPGSITLIGQSAFQYCENLQAVYAKDIESWLKIYFFPEYLYPYASSYANPLVYANNLYFNNVLATEITIPEGFESINMFAFSHCTSLTSVTIPDSVTTIHKGAFEYCENLTSITIPDSVTSISWFAFRYCKSLTSITIPDSVTAIGDSAFDDCTSLTNVYYTGSEDEWKKISIDRCNNDLTNATIHYNSTGPSDNPNSGGDLNKVNIDFTTYTYEVEVGDTVTVSATVTCPAGVENSNLDMVWEVVDPDGTEIVLDGEYSRSKTEWACYAEIKGLKEGTYYINLRDNNSTVFDTVKIVVKSDDNIFDHPGGGGDIVVDKTIYPTEAKISGNATNLIYDNDWWKWDKKKFQVSGTIDNVLSQYDTWNAAKAESKKKYYNSKGVNQLKDLYITLKSPDTKKIYFKGGKSEITFPLGRTIGAGGSDTFECDVYVDRDYYPPKGSEVIPLECILNGNLNGKIISGVYSTFDIRITNKSYEWEKQSLKELIAELKSMVRPYEAYYRQNIGPLYGGTALFEDMTAVEVAYSAGSLASSLELGETCFDIIYYFSNMNFTLGDVAKEYGKAFMELLSKDSHDKVSEIIGAMESRLLHNEYFDGFIEWCRVNYGVDAGAYAKYSNHCPTDIIVTSEDGKTVLQIVGDQIVICDDYITAYVFESNKTFYLPTDIDHEIKITATDNGTMDYFVETVTTHGEKRVVEYNDITLSKGEIYKAIAPNDISSKTDVYNLVSENGKIIKANNEQIDHTFGDKDAKCKDCGFDRTQGCSCNCHKGGIKGFFFKFLLFFQKIFKTNKECKCGVAHY